MTNGQEEGYRWWLRYVIVPLFAGGGIIAIVVALLGQKPTDETFKVSFRYTHLNLRGEADVKPGEPLTIYNEPGGCPPNDLAQYLVDEQGRVQALNRDSCGQEMRGLLKASSCSQASSAAPTVECCRIEEGNQGYRNLVTYFA